jgi:hypothetical protein
MRRLLLQQEPPHQNVFRQRPPPEGAPRILIPLPRWQRCLGSAADRAPGHHPPRRHGAGVDARTPAGGAQRLVDASRAGDHHRRRLKGREPELPLPVRCCCRRRGVRSLRLPPRQDPAQRPLVVVRRARRPRVAVPRTHAGVVAPAPDHRGNDFHGLDTQRNTRKIQWNSALLKTESYSSMENHFQYLIMA